MCYGMLAFAKIPLEIRQYETDTQRHPGGQQDPGSSQRYVQHADQADGSIFSNL